MLILCMSLSIMACNSYKYNYQGEKYQVQYDENLLQVTPSKTSEYDDIFIQPKDGYFVAYVDVALIDKHYGEPREILDNMQKYFLSTVVEGKVENESIESKTGRYKKSTTNIVEYNYTIVSSQATQTIMSRVETIGENQFVVIYRCFEGFYSEDMTNALKLSYESAKLDL